MAEGIAPERQGGRDAATVTNQLRGIGERRLSCEDKSVSLEGTSENPLFPHAPSGAAPGGECHRIQASLSGFQPSSVV